MHSREYNLRAVTLSSMDVGERDVLTTFFTLERGRLQLAVKGTKKTASSLRGATDMFNVGECLAVSRRGTDLLTEWLPASSSRALKTDLEKYALASYFVRFILELTAAGQAEPKLYVLLENIFFIMQTNDKYDIMKLIFELGFLEISGQAFDFSLCIGCGKEIDGNAGGRLDVPAGGILCESCSAEEKPEDSIKLGFKTINCGKNVIEVYDMLSGELLRGGNRIKSVITKINRIDRDFAFPGENSAGRLHSALARFLQYHVSERYSSSWHMRI